MASPEDDFAGDSLFEGMVLFSPSDLSSSSPFPPPPPPPPSPPPPKSPSPPSSPPPTSESQSQPLDEDLFSDLTLQSQPQSQPLEASESVPTASRQISRKKKRAVRIGYARDDTNSKPSDVRDRVSEARDVRSELDIRPDPNTQFVSEAQNQSKVEILPSVGEDRDNESREEKSEVEIRPDPEPQLQSESPIQAKDEILASGGEEREPLDSMEDKLKIIRAQVASKIDKIREMIVMLTKKRKEIGRRRRQTMENMNLAAEDYKELEKELAEACEVEDFEKAERVSESLAEKEKEKDGLVGELRDVEVECDEADLKMQEVLESLIAAEEEGAGLLEQFAKDAADHADLVHRRAEEISSKQLEEWESSMELLEIKKIEMDIESQLVSEAHLVLESSIEHLVEEDRKEVELLRSKQAVLSKELDELLALVRLKEAEIAENDSQIHKVEKKISEAVSEFRGTQASIDMKQDNLQLSLSKLESESEALSSRKKKIDDFILQAQQEHSRLRELANNSLEEVWISQDLVGLRKSLASSILESREDKAKFAKTEEIILDEVQSLRQQISAARTSLQELSSTRVSVQQEITSFNQRITFIDKRGPELEAEKKIAASARNFKEAGRIAAEAKALNLEKESLEQKIEKAVFDRKKLEEEIKATMEKIQENEGLILLKEREVAMAGCKRLQLVAASARAERSAALEMGDTEEGESLLKEAEAAESKARELQETYNLEPEEHEKTLRLSVSIALIANLGGKQLAEMASLLNPSPSVES